MYQRADLTNVGAMGHSQGGGATTTAARDARIKAVIVWNATPSSSKPFLAVSGEMDLAGAVTSFRSAVQAAPKAAFLWYKHPKGNGSLRGHLDAHDGARARRGSDRWLVEHDVPERPDSS